MKLWRCPLCGDGVRAPARMRRNNSLRYCLPCSGKTGKLVERICPSAEAERERRAAQAKAEAEKRKERVAAKSAEYAKTERGSLEAKCAEWLGLDAFKDGLKSSRARWRSGTMLFTYQVRLAQEKLKTFLKRHEETNPDGSLKSVTYTEYTGKYRQRESTGRAYYHRGHFVITAGSDYADALTTILHEIAHLATWDDRGHGPAWRACFADAVEEVTGVRPHSTGDKHAIHDACREVMRVWYEKQLTPAPPVTTVVP